MHRPHPLIYLLIPIPGIFFILNLNQSFSQDLKQIETVEQDTVVSVSPTNQSQVVHKKSPTGALFRSMIIPGWGQAYTGKWLKALIYFGSDVGMRYGAYHQNRLYQENLDYSKHQKSEYIRLQYEDAADFYRNDRNRLIWWTAGLTLLSMFDAYVEGHLYDYRIDPTVGITQGSQSITLGISLTIPLSVSRGRLTAQ